MLLRKRDFLVACIAAALVYIAFKSDSVNYSLEPAWFLDTRGPGALDGKAALASRFYKDVFPVVTDLNGDGSKEIVLITKDMQLKILSANEINSENANGIYKPEELASARLTTLNFQKGKAPVALKTGYVHPYDESQERSQVIVVVREDWTVTCYDESLKILWEKAVAHKTHEIDSIIDKYSIDEVSVHMTSLHVREGERHGMIIVGASMSLRKPDDHSNIKLEHGLDMSESGAAEHVDLAARASLEHFSIYALDAGDGSVVWRHDGSDVRAEQYSRSLPQHAYKLDSRDLMMKTHRSARLNHWELFKQSLIAELPHDWRGGGDTSLRMAHFVRRHLGAAAQREAPLPSKARQGAGPVPGAKGASSKKRAGKIVSGEGARFTGIETPPIPLSATLPHDASEHAEYPNVIVAHTMRGVEVVSLLTGTPITSLALAQGRTYADVDGDGVVDSISVVEDDLQLREHDSFAHHGSLLTRCSVVVLSGLPPKAQLFNGTVCPQRLSLHDKGARGAGRKNAAGRSSLQARYAAAAPVILRRIDPKTLEESADRDVVIAVNVGAVTCYSGKGTMRWQVKNGPLWKLSEGEGGADQSGHSVLFDSDASRVDDLGKHDNVHAQLLVVGSDKMALISRDGEVLASASLHKLPLGRPVIGDFDSDGVTDVIIVTEDAILGYKLSVVQRLKALLLSAVILVVVAAVVFVANIQTVGLAASVGAEILSSASSTASSSANAKTVRKHILTLARSTDDYHLD